MIALNQRRQALSAARVPVVGLAGLLLACLLVCGPALAAQQTPAPPAQTQPAQTQSPQTQSPKPQASVPSPPAAVPTEDDLRRQLTGKTWYLRGMQLGDSLRFSMRGELLDHADTGSYTLCLVRIDKVHLTRTHLELDGARYALHFLGALPYEDPQKSSEEIRITPQKKLLRITIEREPIVKPKKSRTNKKHPAQTHPAVASVAPAAAVSTASATSAPPASNPAASEKTDSPAVAAQTLADALQRILAPSLDASMLASLPDDWQLYYAAQRSGRAFTPGGDVLPSSAVDHSARLIHAIDPPSNSYAQANGIAGRALYRVVVSASGKPARIAIVRPIGFGLDENAVAAIQSASFAPALKSSQPVAEALDIAVMFRIYSKLTDTSSSRAAAKAAAASPTLLPGPYSVKP